MKDLDLQLFLETCLTQTYRASSSESSSKKSRENFTKQVALSFDFDNCMAVLGFRLNPGPYSAYHYGGITDVVVEYLRSILPEEGAYVDVFIGSNRQDHAIDFQNYVKHQAYGRVMEVFSEFARQFNTLMQNEKYECTFHRGTLSDMAHMKSTMDGGDDEDDEDDEDDGDDEDDDDWDSNDLFFDKVTSISALEIHTMIQQMEPIVSSSLYGKGFNTGLTMTKFNTPSFEDNKIFFNIYHMLKMRALARERGISSENSQFYFFDDQKFILERVYNFFSTFTFHDGTLPNMHVIYFEGGDYMEILNETPEDQRKEVSMQLSQNMAHSGPVEYRRRFLEVDG